MARDRTLRANIEFIYGPHVNEVVGELVQRWERAAGTDHEFSQGRAEGYVQAISLLLQVPHADIVKALQARRIR